MRMLRTTASIAESGQRDTIEFDQYGRLIKASPNKPRPKAK
jgi:hypothetical protein